MIQAGAMAKGGEVLLIDIGEPIKIDLAKNDSVIRVEIA